MRAAPVPDGDLATQRTAVEAFLAAARDGDLEGLLAVLDPDVELHAQTRGGRRHLRGAAGAAEQAPRFAGRVGHARPVLVDGAAGVVVEPGGTRVAVLAFTVAGGRIRHLVIWT